MSVQAAIIRRTQRDLRGSGFYLMELRRHVAETNSLRRKLAIASWSVPKVHVVPILNRNRRFGEA